MRKEEKDNLKLMLQALIVGLIAGAVVGLFRFGIENILYFIIIFSLSNSLDVNGYFLAPNGRIPFYNKYFFVLIILYTYLMLILKFRKLN